MPTSGTVATNVTTGKPKVGGAVYVAPLGTSVPTDTTTALNSAFVSLGYISEDGVINADTTETEKVKAWGGDTVDVIETSRDDKFKFKLIEALSIDVLKTIYGSANVTGTALTSGVTVKAKAGVSKEYAWVFEMILRGNIAKRIVIPDATISEMEDIVYKDNDATGYGITIEASADSSGNTHYEYLKGPVTTPSGG